MLFGVAGENFAQNTGRNALSLGFAFANPRTRVWDAPEGRHISGGNRLPSETRGFGSPRVRQIYVEAMNTSMLLIQYEYVKKRRIPKPIIL